MHREFQSEGGRWKAAAADEMEQVDVAGWLSSMLAEDEGKPAPSYQSLAKLHFVPTGQVAQTAALAAHRGLEQQRINLEAGLDSDGEQRPGQIWRIIAENGSEEARIVRVREAPRLLDEIGQNEMIVVGPAVCLTAGASTALAATWRSGREWNGSEIVPIADDV
jgi:hypothetical protein